MSQLSTKTKGLITRIQEKIPDQQVGLVPADAFFMRMIELPKGLSSEEAAAFIQLDMEGNSPFPMDQLAWGYLQDKDSPNALAYATPKARLKRLDFTSIESYHQLFPGFVTLYRDPVETPTIRFLSQSGVVSALYLRPGQSVPVRILSMRIKGDLQTDDIQLETRKHLLATLKLEDYSCEDGLWLGQETEIASDGAVRFRHRHITDDRSLGLKDHIIKLPTKSLWAIDLRDSLFAAKESQIRQKSHFIWKSLQVAAGAAIVLLVLQIGNFGLKGFTRLIDAKIAKIEPYAIRVENKMTLADKLTQSTEEDIKPFNLLEAINPLRPDSIFFEKIRCRSYNELEVEGQSTQGVTPVNAFADSINQLAYVDSVENNSQTIRNQTSFSFVIRFSDIPPPPEGGFVIPEEPEDAAESEEGGEG